MVVINEKHTLKQCAIGIHIKAFKDQKSSQFECCCCFRLMEAVKCPSCLSMALIDEHNGTLTCNAFIDSILRCEYNFIGHLDIVEPEEIQEKSLLEKILEEDSEKHPLGFSKGVVHRDFQ